MNQEETNQYLEKLGSCDNFPVKAYIEVMNFLAAYDEPMRAKAMLNMVPAFYRDNPNREMLTLDHAIDSKLATPHFYSQNIWDQIHEQIGLKGKVTLEGTCRGVLIEEDVKKTQAHQLGPHIIDLGPGEYWVPYGLRYKGYKFTYQAMGLQNSAHAQASKELTMYFKEWTPGQPIIFLACELIEHLHNESDIKTDLLRTGLTPDVIHISTPKYTFDGRAERLDWMSKGDLGHLRTYTPMELHTTVTKMFRDYKWSMFDGQILHMRGINPNGIFSG